MVRPEAAVALEQTYAYRLQHELDGVHVHNASVRANSSRDILADSYFRDEHVAPSVPDILILQIGIVDCTPRIIGTRERRLLQLASHVPVIRNAAHWFIRRRSERRYDLTRRRPFSLVPFDEYAANLASFLDRVRAQFPTCQFLHVPVPCPTGPMVDRNFGIVDVVARYNAAAVDAVVARGGASVPFFEFTRDHPETLLADGYHLGPDAHLYLARALGALVKERQEPSRFAVSST